MAEKILECEECKSTRIRVIDTQDLRKKSTKITVKLNCICTNCDHVFDALVLTDYGRTKVR